MFNTQLRSQPVLARLYILLLLCIFSVSTVSAQPSSCPSLVETALAYAEDSCISLGRNTVCYGHGTVEALDFEQAPLPNFVEPGDVESVLDLSQIVSSAMDVEMDVWGVALLSLQADLPDTSPGQNVTFVMFGDSTIETVQNNAYREPLQAFRFTTGVGRPLCEDAPDDGLLIQAPDDTTVSFLINGVEVNVGSTTYLQFDEEQSADLTINTFDGSVDVTSGDETVTVGPGFSVVASEAATLNEPEPYEYERVVNAPVELLPNPVTIPVVVPGTKLDGWVDTSIELEAGQSYTITATGTVNLFNDCESYKLADPGMPDDFDCSTMIVGPDGLSSTPAESGAPPIYPAMDVRVGALLGRIGEGDLFEVSDGGTFTAEQSGELQFRVNDDNDRQDNDGAFIVTVEIDSEAS